MAAKAAAGTDLGSQHRREEVTLGMEMTSSLRADLIVLVPTAPRWHGAELILFAFRLAELDHSQGARIALGLIAY